MPRPPIHWPEPRGDIHIVRGKRGVRATVGAPTEGSPGSALTKQDKWLLRLNQAFEETLDKADAAQKISRNRHLPARIRKQAEDAMLKHIRDADKISDKMVKSNTRYFRENKRTEYKYARPSKYATDLEQIKAEIPESELGLNDPDEPYRPAEPRGPRDPPHSRGSSVRGGRRTALMRTPEAGRGWPPRPPQNPTPPKGGGGGAQVPKGTPKLNLIQGGEASTPPKGPGKLGQLAEGAGRLGRGIGRAAGVMAGVGIILEAIRMGEEVKAAKEAQQKRLRNADLLM